MCVCPQNKHQRLMSLLPELRELAHRGEDYLYQKHDTNSPTSLLIEMLHARRGTSHAVFVRRRSDCRILIY